MRCRVEVPPVRAEPDEAAEQVTQLLKGEPVAVKEQAGEWARILTAYDYAGWVGADALEEGDGRFRVAFADPLAAAQAFVVRRTSGAG